MLKFIRSLFFLMIAIFLIVSCSEESTSPQPNDITAANELAIEGFQLLNDEILEAEETDLENVDEGNDIFSENIYNEIKAKFDEALVLDTDNPMAHLGLAILEVASVNYDNELWDIYNDIDTEFNPNNRILNNQFKFLGKTPKLYLNVLTNPFDRDDEISFARIQNFIEDNVLPKIDNAIDHLSDAISLADSSAIMIDTGEEFVEIDCGEIYAFRSSMYAISAAFKLIILYDFDLFDENNSYDWLHQIEDLDDSDDDWWDDYDNYYIEYIDGENWLILEKYWDYTYCQQDSIIFDVMKFNLEERPEFGQFRSGQSPNSIQNDLISAVNDLENAVNYIENEDDPQSNDIIKLEYITDFEDDLDDLDPDAPNFAQEWNDIHDVIDWISGLLTETYELTENGVTFEINLSRLFNPGLNDLEEYFPYFTWKSKNEWINMELDWEDVDWNYGYDYTFYCNGEYIIVDNIDYVHRKYFDYDIEPSFFTDGPNGAEIDNEEIPYFPDYTFNGIFPDMTRTKMENLFED